MTDLICEHFECPDDICCEYCNAYLACPLHHRSVGMLDDGVADLMAKATDAANAVQRTVSVKLEAKDLEIARLRTAMQQVSQQAIWEGNYYTVPYDAIQALREALK